MVRIFNEFYFRPRPFDSLDVELLFYPPTDSSFPANPIAIVIAMSAGAWMANKTVGYAMYTIAIGYGFARIYAGVFYPTDAVAGTRVNPFVL